VKVIDLLKKLKGQAIEEGNDEEVMFSKFKYWCSTSTDELKKAIEEEKQTIEVLEKKIEAYKKQKKELEEQIKELEKQLTEIEESAKKAKEADEKRTKLYTEEKADLESTISAVGEAIQALEEAGTKTESKLLQVQARAMVRQALALISTKTTDEQQSALTEFANADPERPEQLAAGDEAAHVDKYKFKSGNVIDLLKGLKLKFEDDLTAADTAETNAANEYALEKQARDAAQKAAEKSKTQKSEMLSETESSLADAEGDLKDEKADLKADKETLETTEKTCATRTEEWEVRSKTRTNEIEAIEAAIKILGKVTGVRTETPKNPVLPTSPIEFVQIDNPKDRAIKLIRAAAQTTHSKALEKLATQINAQSGKHFD
jgi:prefoldin subunit 5